ncbi:hypothetical protein [Microvirga massiliensis]|uniref:hypothetical protein n=1 Tax=Microvirga massiliensis TaxID=1033741 RepID=UPI00062B7B01|nr:hypothetical protein [Microvirga massiliensis]
MRSAASRYIDQDAVAPAAAGILHAMLPGAAAAAIISILALTPAAAEFQTYPGATPSPELEAAASREEVQIGLDPDEGMVSYFTSPDPFEDVLAYYLQLGREFAMPPMPGLADNGHDRGLAAEITFSAQGLRAVPTGVRVKQAFVILDGAQDITESRDWLTIIRPIVTGTRTRNAAGWRFTPVRTENATAIVRMQR